MSDLKPIESSHYQDSADRSYFVYRAYDATGQLLYVGCTKRLDIRWREHKTERPAVVAETVRCRLQGPYTRAKARELERLAICTEEPVVGWTLAKHREKLARNKWITQRSNELLVGSTELHDAYAAISAACAEAEEFFPHPYEHEHPHRRGGLKAVTA